MADTATISVTVLRDMIAGIPPKLLTELMTWDQLKAATREAISFNLTEEENAKLRRDPYFPVLGISTRAIVEALAANGKEG